MRPGVDRRGFTLIELLVIIIIIAVVSSIVVPSYSRFFARARFSAAVRDVRDLFAYAREQAVVGDTTVTVSFDPHSLTFVAMVTPAPPPTDQPVVFGSSDSPAAGANVSPPAPQTVQLGEEYAVPDYQTGGQAGQGQTGAGGDIHFHGDGSCEGAQIQLMSAAGYQTRLILWPSTGRVTVEEP